jgi:hypothetical protein
VVVKKISWINTKTHWENSQRRQDQIMLRDRRTRLYHEEYFNELVALEKKRCERSEGSVLLMLADLSAFTDLSKRQEVVRSMMDVLSDVTRDTDVKGWHVDGLVIGIMFTEMGDKEGTLRLARRHITKKCSRRLQSHLGVENYSRIQITWQSIQGGRILEIQRVSKV